jgi:hypothetical protein
MQIKLATACNKNEQQDAKNNAETRPNRNNDWEDF